jgi:predicted dehydrogenase
MKVEGSGHGMDSPEEEPGTVGVAVIGAGYWGPNLIRNVLSNDRCELRWVCDLDTVRAAKVLGRRSPVRITADVNDVLNDPEVQAVVIATPSSTHRRLGLAALNAGKHVLMEKPLATTVEEGEELVAAAAANNRILMCDFTFCYTPVVQRLRSMINDGDFGELLFIDSTRVNLGLIQNDIDVFWDLGPHDLSILDFILPEENRPISVSASGADPLRSGQACVGFMSLQLGGGAIAHVNLSWLSPTKIRTTVVSGAKRTAIWDDLKVGARLSLYDAGVGMVAYRTGDIVTPAIPEREALGSVINELVTCIETGRTPATDGHAGLRVLRVLEAAGRSVASGSTAIPLEF